MSDKSFSLLMRSAALAALLAGGMAAAQPMTQEMQQGMYDAQVRKQRARQQQQSGPTAAEIRAWEAREAEIQARIARHRATPYWMAIAWNFDNNGVTFPGGFSSKERAVERATTQCTSAGNCRVVATFANACAVIVVAVPKPSTVQEIFVGIDKDDKTAAAKAWQSCQSVYGDREDRCFYSTAPTAHGTAFCTGYDYSLYGHE